MRLPSHKLHMVTPSSFFLSKRSEIRFDLIALGHNIGRGS